MWKIILASLISGITLGLSLDCPSLWFFSLIGLIPLLYTFRQVTERKNIFKAGLIFGAAFGGTSYIWLWSLLPTGWSGITPTIGFFLVFFIWTLPVLGHAGIWGAWSYLLSFLPSKTRFGLLVIPASWILFEYLNTWVFAVVTYAPQSLFGSHYTFASIGYALANHPLILQLAQIDGVYLLGFLAIFCNVLLYKLWFEKKWKHSRYLASAMFLVIVGTGLIPFSPARENTTSFLVSVLHTNLPTPQTITDEIRTERDAVHQTLLEEIAVSGNKPSLIVFPEDSRFTSSLIEKNNLGLYDNLFEDGILIIDSGFTKKASSSPYNRIFLYKTGEGEPDIHDKKLLAPFGEYLPSGAAYFLTGLGFESIESSYERYRTYEKGSDTASVGGKNPQVGVLLCSEIVSPSLSKDLKHAGAQVIVNESSHGRFHASHILFNQTQSMAKVRAVENRVPLIYAGNIAPSFILDKFGNVRSKTGWGENSVLSGNIEIE